MNNKDKVNDRMSIGIEDDKKAQLVAEADKIGMSLAEYVRRILKDRDKILNSPDAHLIEREELENLQIENQRLRQMTEYEPDAKIEEQIQEINALTSENEALRADMELLRTEAESTSDSDEVAVLEEKLTAAKAVIEEAEFRLSDLEKVHDPKDAHCRDSMLFLSQVILSTE